MSVRVRAVVLALAGAVALAPATLAPTPAHAGVLSTVCSVAGDFNGLLGKGCRVATSGKQALGALKQVAKGHPLSAIKQALSGGGGAASGIVSATARRAATLATLAVVALWVAAGARYALKETAHVLSSSTEPRLGAAWFSGTYWRVAALGALLTLPFLFAAAIQAVAAADLSMLARAAFGYLPLSLLAVAIATPLIGLLLTATDEMSGLVSAAAGADGGHFLALAGGLTAIGAAARSPFMAMLLAAVVASGALVLWLELLVRDAAVYVVVLLLPLTFAAMVWPARRGWALRAVELLVALILAKFVVVAVLSLGAAALGHWGSAGLGGLLTGAALVLLAAFSPWAVLRMVPIAEVAGGALASMRGELQRPVLAHAGIAGELAPPPQTVAADPGVADDTRSTAGRLVGALGHPSGGSSRGAHGAAGETTGGDPGVPAGNWDIWDGAATVDRQGRPATVAGTAPAAGPGMTDSSPGPSPEPAEEPGRQGPPGGGPAPVSFADPASTVLAGGTGTATTTEIATTGDPAASGDLAGPAGPGAGGAAPPPRERLPGMEPIWQADDLSWPAIPLGLDHDWEPRPFPDPGAADGPDDPPLPEPQEPDEGRL